MTAGNAAHTAFSPSKDPRQTDRRTHVPGSIEPLTPDLMPAPNEHAMIAPSENVTSSGAF